MKSETVQIDAAPDTKMGQVFTPEPIARFMASMNCAAPKCASVLDAGSGRGVLSKALVRWLSDNGCLSVHVDAFELDRNLAYQTEQTLSDLHAHLSLRDMKMTFTVHASDFLEVGADLGPFSEKPMPRYDFAILNPPYFKISHGERYSRSLRSIFQTQPNIYALFVILALRLLKPGGELTVIAPRSWLSGEYFSQIRTEILSHLDIIRIHTFRSRGEAFGHQNVLQETIIFHGHKMAVPRRNPVSISVSQGIDDIIAASILDVPWEIVCQESPSVGIRLPESLYQLSALNELSSFPHRLIDLDAQVSTGPVVAFRSRQFLRQTASSGENVPLVWMTHIRPGLFQWTNKSSQRQPPYIAKERRTIPMLILGENMVLVRRFSAKEDRHRLIACFLPQGTLGDLIGIENHVNVIRGIQRPLSTPIAKALTNYLNSEITDQYIRAVSGTTQINARDLMRLPIPDKGSLVPLWEHPVKSLLKESE